MKTPRHTPLAAVLAGLMAASVLAPAMAQPATTDADTRVVADTDRDDGFDDWGLLGLLGLLGLIPRKNKDTVHTYNDPNRSVPPPR